jgi:hypothetical protein
MQPTHFITFGGMTPFTKTPVLVEAESIDNARFFAHNMFKVEVGVFVYPISEWEEQSTKFGYTGIEHKYTAEQSIRDLVANYVIDREDVPKGIYKENW